MQRACHARSNNAASAAQGGAQKSPIRQRARQLKAQRATALSGSCQTSPRPGPAPSCAARQRWQSAAHAREHTTTECRDSSAVAADALLVAAARLDQRGAGAVRLAHATAAGAATKSVSAGARALACTPRAEALRPRAVPHHDGPPAEARQRADAALLPPGAVALHAGLGDAALGARAARRRGRGGRLQRRMRVSVAHAWRLRCLGCRTAGHAPWRARCRQLQRCAQCRSAAAHAAAGLQARQRAWPGSASTATPCKRPQRRTGVEI